MNNKSIFEKLPLAILILNAGMRVVYANAAARSIINLSEVDGQNSLQDVAWVSQSGEPLTQEKHPVAQSFINGEEVSGIIIGFSIASDKQFKWIEAHCIPGFEDGNPKPAHVVFTFSQAMKPLTSNSNHSGEEEVTDDDETKTISESDIMNRIGQAVIVTDLQGNITYTNGAASKMYGWTREEFIKRNVLDTTVPDTSSVEARQIMKKLAGGESWSGEFEVKRKDGTVFMAFVTDTPIFNKDGVLTGIIGVSSDITKDKKAETDLISSENRFLTLFRSNPTPSGITRASDYRIVDVNDAWCKLTGYSRGEAIGHSPVELGLINPETLSKVRGISQNHNAIQQTEIEINTRHAELRYVLINSELIEIDGEKFILNNLLDITARKQYEEQLTKLAERLNLATQSAGIGIWDWNIRKNEIVWDEKMVALYGLQQGEFKGAYEAWLNGVHPDDREESNKISQSAVLGEREYDTEFRVLWPDGSVHWLKAGGKVFRDENSNAIRMVGVNYDITQRKQAEENRLISEQKYTLLFNKSGTPSLVFKFPGGIIAEVNEKVEELTGYSRDEMIGKTSIDVGFVSPDNRDTILDLLKHNEAILDYELPVIAKNGEKKTVLVNAVHFKMADIHYIMTTWFDITSRKRAEENLRMSLEREQFLGNLIRNASIAVGVGYPDGRLGMCNIAFQELTGYSEDELKTLHWNSVLTPPEWLEKETVLLETLARTKQHLTYEKEYIHKSGRRVPIELVVHPFLDMQGSVTHYYAFITDITERKKTEEQLRSSEAKFKAVFDNAPVGISLLDNQRNLLESNNMLSHIVHMDEDNEAARGYKALKYIREDGSEMPENELASARAINEQQSIRNVVKGIVLEDGEIVWTQVSASPLGPNDDRYVVITQDITGLKQAVDALWEKERRLRKTIETTSDGFWIVDPGRRFIEVNEAYCTMSGYSRTELMSMTITDVEAIESQTDTNDHIQKIIRHGSDRFETIHRRKDGSLFDVEVSVNVLDLEQGLMICFCRDITERKLAEKQIRESEKRFATIFEDSPVAIAISRLQDGKTIMVNSAIIDLLGYNQDELTGLTSDESGIWVNSADRQHFVKTLSKVQRVEGMEASLRKKSGEKCQVMIWGELIELAGEPCMMAEVIDITEKKNTEEEIRMQNEKLNAILNALPDKLFVHDAIGNFLEAYTTDPGGFIVPLDKFIGKNLKDIFPKEVADLNLKYLYECRESNKIIIHEFSVDYKGVNSHFEVRVVPFMEDKVIRFVRDITERKEIEKQIVNLNKAIEQSPAAIVITDPDANITYASRAFEHITGYTKDEVIGKNPRILKSGKNSKELYTQMWKTIKSGETWTGELINKKKDGSFYWELLAITPLFEKENKITGFLGVKQDVTEKKKIEQEILDLNISLERKVEERTLELKRINEELVKAKEAAEDANKAKSIFLANMSHEIRTPLNSIIGFSELLFNSSIDEKKRSQVISIRNSGRSLLKIINDILDLSKVEAGKIVIEREPLNVFKIVSDVGSMFEQKAAEKKLDLTIESETDLITPLLLDETRLRQILFNLIGNAIKFTSVGGVSVIIRHQEKEDDYVDLSITISDTGIGIPQNQLETIFEPFVQQAGQVHKTFGGTGLGLVISRRMAEAMGGEIRVKSVLNSGSEFTICLRNVAKATALPKEHENVRAIYETVSFKGNTILIVDDIADNRKLLVDVLEPTGARLYEAENGTQAVRMAIALKPDIMLMDIRMPLMNGLEACRILRNNPDTAKIPCIAVSASIKLGKPSQDIPENFEDNLMKPVDFGQLFEILLRYLKHSVPTDFGGQVESLSINDEDMAWPDDLKQFAKDELVPLYYQVMRTQLVDEMEAFGKKLIETGHRFNHEMLVDTGRKLGGYADQFEVDKLIQTMQEFQFVLNRKIK